MLFLKIQGNDGIQTLHAINLTAAGGSINLGTNIIQSLETPTDSNYRPSHAG